MQAICGKVRLVGRQTANILKNADSRAVRDNSKFTSWNGLDYLSPSSSQLDSRPIFMLWKEHCTKTNFLRPPKSNGVVPVAKYFTVPTPSLQQLPAVITTQRCFATLGNPVESVPQDASASIPDVPPRIKFKRLDKTARHIMQILDKEAVEEVKAKREIPDIKPGYIVQLKVEVPENKRRVSVVKGIVMARRNAGLNTTFRIRRLVAGVGVESLYPLYSPNLKEIKVLDKKKVRRAKLYYLRDKMNALKKH
ncbi:hypothetical protein M9H77_24441 [Catharanthus roseus]|uniref:Uncharacterized protein n=1 Tax=Catharanthus roseus TaxID=4058 RepID=A0ACC0AYX3_CATRO|nr:hypothetical protein M9H77_24441 [Catharanthus roseus]